MNDTTVLDLFKAVEILRNFERNGISMKIPQTPESISMRQAVRAFGCYRYAFSAYGSNLPDNLYDPTKHFPHNMF